MAFYQFTCRQYIDASLEEVWDFIATPSNLNRITPQSMGFEILTSDLPSQMYEGMIIHYRVRPLPFYTTEWVTEITHIKHGDYFVDEQRVGPYKMWHHQHRLQPSGSGVEMFDIVSYQLPMGLLGRLGNYLVVTNRLKQIFDYRKKAIDEYFVRNNRLCS
ncbi:SRPBCC family protein [Carboxylicivirga sp. A043]|uniref:SRPBCC family protein n=1 Tax=Carboxylicivirga litoralis TaxID=2816963 RepID=UPI0021CB823E|nr:SRPBCC family protein [Carboxylicivirga sp. A043]MCU4154477.1 SRPBCC family protein [Carboxylicivirga sp. A043]